MSQSSRDQERPSPDQEVTNPPDVWMREEGLTPYEVMLRSAPADYLTNFEAATHEVPPEYPVYYFFYGTLTAPATLARILDLPEEPRLRKAQIIGYTVAKWSEDEDQKLAYYETKPYKATPCWIFFTDQEGPADTSMYAGDASALLEGCFDRKLWEVQMAGKLS